MGSLWEEIGNRGWCEERMLVWEGMEDLYDEGHVWGSCEEEAVCVRSGECMRKGCACEKKGES